MYVVLSYRQVLTVFLTVNKRVDVLISLVIKGVAGLLMIEWE